MPHLAAQPTLVLANGMAVGFAMGVAPSGETPWGGVARIGVGVVVAVVVITVAPHACVSPRLPFGPSHCPCIDGAVSVSVPPGRRSLLLRTLAAAFPGRLFNLLDMLEWNASYGFLNCKRHLSLFETDAEHHFKSKECIDSTELWKYNSNESSNDGDLHYPVTLPGAGKYDLVTFSQTLEHIYDPVRHTTRSCPTMAA